MKRFLLVALSFTFSLYSSAQDTFSIVAVDPATREIGSAGASCITNSKIISSIVPEIGAIHTQASYIAGNQQNGFNYMTDGYSPKEIIEMLKTNDVQGDSTHRQYGVVVLKDGGSAASYTGDSCLDYKNHITGPTYSIQGNILLGQQVLDSMQARFLREPGPLHFKLMAALQGANIPGADSRCLGDNKPAISAFIRLYKPGDDTLKKFFMDINVRDTKGSNNPIDSLQKLFNKQTALGVTQQKQENIAVVLRPNPAQTHLSIRYYVPHSERTILRIFDLSGKEVYAKEQSAPLNCFEVDLNNWNKGLYFYRINDSKHSSSGKLVVN